MGENPKDPSEFTHSYYFAGMDDIISGLRDDLLKGFEPVFKPYADQLREAIFPVLESMLSLGKIDTTRLFSRSLPPNLIALGADLPLFEVVNIGRNEGISLYGIPRTSIARRLIRAPDSSARRRILSACSEEILYDCNEALDQATYSKIKFPVAMIRDAIGAVRSGYWISAQAAAAAAVDGVAKISVSDERLQATITRTGRAGKRDDTLLEELTLREALALFPVYGAHGNYHSEDPIPFAFSRHATVHSASRRQYSKINAIQSIMVTTGLILWVNDISQRRL